MSDRIMSNAPPRPELLELMHKAAQHKMTPAERQAQKISFAYGMLPSGSNLTRDDVANMIYEREGNLTEMQSQIDALKAENERLREQLQLINDKAIMNKGEFARYIRENSVIPATDATTKTADNDAPP